MHSPGGSMLTDGQCDNISRLKTCIILDRAQNVNEGSSQNDIFCSNSVGNDTE